MVETLLADLSDDEHRQVFGVSTVTGRRLETVPETLRKKRKARIAFADKQMLTTWTSQEDNCVPVRPPTGA
jgi:hypothetical protein